MSTTDRKDEYTQLARGARYVELSDRCLVGMTGVDRQSFFHNFCTNDIKKLKVGEICEAFVLNTKGKILGYVHAIAGENELLLTGHGDQAATLVNHLEMYLIREEVELADVTPDFVSIFIHGDGATEKLNLCCDDVPAENRMTETSLCGIPVRISQIEIAGFGYFVLVEKNKSDELKQGLNRCGIVECGLDALNVLRVENRTPWFGVDADDSNLPQELQRDPIAISLEKGCYLGQETVARIDARGRVNQVLVGFQINGSSPEKGEFTYEGKTVGRISSVVFSPQADCYLGLGYVRRQFKEPGTEIGDLVVL